MTEFEMVINRDCQVAASMLMPMAGMIFYCLEMIRGILKGNK